MKSDIVYLQHIRDAILKIIKYSGGDRNKFFNTDYLQDAIIRELEIIGEASKKISPNTKTVHNHISWRRLAGLRDILIHNYMSVDLEIVWEITEQKIPQLKLDIENLIQSLSNSEK